MAIPPTRAPTWATDGGADVTDPGSSKQATGWIESEAPAADHTNWVWKNQGEAFDFLFETLGGMIALGNIERTGTQPFLPSTGSVEMMSIRYDSVASRWYCSVLEANTNDVTVYDSVDGVTWNAGVDMDLAASFLTTYPAPQSNGTVIGVFTDEDFYLSTDQTVANLPIIASPTGSYLNIDRLRGGTWDATNNLWIAAGDEFTTNGRVETSPAGATWTTRLTDATNLFTSLAHDGAGNSVVSTDDVTGSTTIHTSSDGTTWGTAATPPTEGINELAWCPSLGLFAGSGVSGNIWFSTDGDVWASAAASGNLPDISNVMTTPDFTVMIGVSGELILFPYAANGEEGFEYYNLGEITTGNAPGLSFRTERSTFHGGQGKLVFYDDAEELAVARYKPPA